MLFMLARARYPKMQGSFVGKGLIAPAWMLLILIVSGFAQGAHAQVWRDAATGETLPSFPLILDQPVRREGDSLFPMEILSLELVSALCRPIQQTRAGPSILGPGETSFEMNAEFGAMRRQVRPCPRFRSSLTNLFGERVVLFFPMEILSLELVSGFCRPIQQTRAGPSILGPGETNFESRVHRPQRP